MVIVNKRAKKIENGKIRITALLQILDNTELDPFFSHINTTKTTLIQRTIGTITTNGIIPNPSPYIQKTPQLSAYRDTTENVM